MQDQDIATILTVQRLRPVLLGYGDMHSGGLDGHHAHRVDSRPPEGLLWINESDNEDDDDHDDYDDEGSNYDGQFPDRL